MKLPIPKKKIIKRVYYYHISNEKCQYFILFLNLFKYVYIFLIFYVNVNIFVISHIEVFGFQLPIAKNYQKCWF